MLRYLPISSNLRVFYVFISNLLLVFLTFFLFLTALSHADFQAGENAYERGEYEMALKEWQTLAEQGNPKAQLALGIMYVQGKGVPQNATEAVRWYRLAAEQGDSEAQEKLGVMYEHGEGVPDYSQARNWYLRAAEQGRVAAQSNLGTIYAAGLGVTQDFEEASRWFHLAAEQGDAISQFNLGLIYFKELNYAKSSHWFHLAANQGLAPAQSKLGLMYYKGEGLPQDYREAVRLFRLAGGQGCLAQLKMGVMYQGGQGVPQDYEEAAAGIAWQRNRGLLSPGPSGDCILFRPRGSTRLCSGSYVA